MAQAAYAHSIRRHDGQPTRVASLGRALADLWISAELAAAGSPPPLPLDSWLDGIQVLTAREREGTTDGLFLAAKGGHNAESHNHNDVGYFIVALDGHPVLIDVGVETYSRKTFSDQRYEIWTMQSNYHNLPLIDGIGQAPGLAFAAQDVSATVQPDRAEITMDLSGAYPEASGARRWLRTVCLERPVERPVERTGRVMLEDAYELNHTPTRLALHLMTSGPVDVAVAGVLRCASPTRPLDVRYDPQQFGASVETIEIDDARLKPVWGDRVYRVVLTAHWLGSTGRWTLTMAAAE